MTTIIAASRAGQIVMGADTKTTVYDRPVMSARKILSLTVDPDLGSRGQLLLGFAGDGALSAAMERNLKVGDVPTPNATIAQRTAWANSVAEAITDIARSTGITDNGHMDGLAVLAHDGHLWTITHMQAIHHPDGIAAIGSGEGPAIGSLDTILGTADDTVDLESAVNLAVMIAIKRDQNSGGDVVIATLGTT